MRDELLLKHPFFVEKTDFDNSGGKQYGFDEVKFNRYAFRDEEGGKLFIFIPLQRGETQWIYRFPIRPYFISKMGCPSSNGPIWMQKLIQSVESSLDG